MTLEAGSSIGKYIVKRKLAEGGMAEIYLATHKGPEGFEKEVVIKRVRAFLAGDEGFVQMFIAEARLASRLNHANVVQIFDFDKHEDSFYLAMEYVRGCSLWDLRKRCREKGLAMPPVLVAHMGAQVAAGLSHAHRLKSPDGELFNLVHRDVTPHNVLLSLDGAVKLTDFGIAKAGNKLTQPGVLKGKFAYMSPEQARGEAVDARTDVFALGIVLWEMLTGGRLFDGDSELAVLRAVQESAIASPTRLNPDVPEDLDEVVTTALDRDPAARFQSASELERALAQCVLRHARSVDDTDVATFVRRALDAPLTQFIPTPAALVDRAQRRSRTEETAAPEPEPAPREATAVLRTDTPSGRGRSVRTPTSEDSLVSASTHVLSSSEPRPERSTLPLPSVHGARDSRPVPVTAAQGEGSGSHAAAPVRVAQVMPVVTSALEPVPAPEQEPAPAPALVSAPEPARAKRSGMGLRAGVGVAALVLIGGVTALVVPAKQPTSPDGSAPTVAAAPSQTPAPAAQAPSEVKAELPAQPAPAPTAAPAEGSTTPSVTASAAEARGTLVLFAKPFATILVSGQKPRRDVQGRTTYSLPPGTYKVTFQHPVASESHDVTVTAGGSVTRSFVARKR